MHHLTIADWVAIAAGLFFLVCLLAIIVVIVIYNNIESHNPQLFKDERDNISLNEGYHTNSFRQARSKEEAQN